MKPERSSDSMRQYERFVKGRMGQGHREDLYDLKDQRFLGQEAFVENVHRQLNEEAPFVYDISLGQIASEVSSALHLPTDLLYSLTRNRQGPWAGR